MNRFTPQIEKGAAYLTQATGSSNWINEIDVNKIRMWVIDNEDPLYLVLGDEEAFIIESEKGLDWLREHAFMTPRVEGDARIWVDIAKQLDAEWREWITSARELMEIAVHAY